ncbi:MAG TPA: JAB domain-containing protein [Phycisphaerae bacterium]|nr:JAB domain-containing protein [Phycisphaerae bacterium]
MQTLLNVHTCTINTHARIAVHNHPDGCPLPSAQDEKVNGKVKQAGEILGIPIIDFVIIGENGRYWSSGNREGQVRPAGTAQK